jgi:hypothetical protein
MKKLLENFTKGLLAFFDTMQGVVRVEKDNQYDFETFMERFDNRKVRKELMLGFDNLFSEINREYDLDAKMTFLGVTSYNIEDIREQHDAFFDFYEKEGFDNPTVLELYSIHKNKMLKTLIKNSFKTLFKMNLNEEYNRPCYIYEFPKKII